MEFIGIVGEGREDTWPRAMQPPRLLMQRVHIPFTFKLKENEPIGYNGEYCFITYCGSVGSVVTNIGLLARSNSEGMVDLISLLCRWRMRVS